MTHNYFLSHLKLKVMNIVNDPNDQIFTRGRKHRHGSDSRVFLGILFVAIGGLLILENLDFLSYDLSRVLISWPMLLIVIGVFNLSRKSGSAGLILIAIGGYFLLPRIFDIPDHFFHNFWPAILVAVGLVFIFQWRKTPNYHFDGMVDKNDVLDETALFGGRNMSLVSEQFKGGKIIIHIGPIKGRDLAHLAHCVNGFKEGAHGGDKKQQRKRDRKQEKRAAREMSEV